MSEQQDEMQSAPLSNAEITFTQRVTGVEEVGEALDMAAINLARYGLDGMNILVTDLDDPDRAWMVMAGGELREVTDFSGEAEEPEPEEPDDEDEPTTGVGTADPHGDIAGGLT